MYRAIVILKNPDLVLHNHIRTHPFSLHGGAPPPRL